MKVIKRNGTIVDFDKKRIINAIQKANEEVEYGEQATLQEINAIIDGVVSQDLDSISVEDIQDIIEKSLMELDRFELAKKYILYREQRK